MILGVLEAGGVGDIHHGVLRRNLNLITIFRGFLACLCGIRTILAIWPRSVLRCGQYRSGNFFASGQFLFGPLKGFSGVLFLALVYQSSGLKSDNFTNPFPRRASSHGPFPDRIVKKKIVTSSNSPILLLAPGDNC
jgi:hypothetical protein